MERIDQTEFGPQGNCKSACLAMMLGVSLDDVPNFLKTRFADKDEQVAILAELNWLHLLGWHTVTMSAAGPFFKKFFSIGYIIAAGMSVRGGGLWHACVYKDGNLWHDPHPDRTGLVAVQHVDIIYPLVPSKHRHFQPSKKILSTDHCVVHRGQSWPGQPRIDLLPVVTICPLCENEYIPRKI